MEHYRFSKDSAELTLLSSEMMSSIYRCLYLMLINGEWETKYSFRDFLDKMREYLTMITDMSVEDRKEMTQTMIEKEFKPE